MEIQLRASAELICRGSSVRPVHFKTMAWKAAVICGLVLIIATVGYADEVSIFPLKSIHQLNGMLEYNDLQT